VLDICLAGAGARRDHAEVPKKLAELVAARNLGRRVGAGSTRGRTKAKKAIGAARARRSERELMSPYLAAPRPGARGAVADASSPTPIWRMRPDIRTGFAPFRGGPLNLSQE